MKPALEKTKCLICHHLLIVPLSSGTSGLSPPSHRKLSPSWRQKEGTLKEGLQDQGETQPCPWGHRGGTQAHRIQVSQRV